MLCLSGCSWQSTFSSSCFGIWMGQVFWNVLKLWGICLRLWWWRERRSIQMACLPSTLSDPRDWTGGLKWTWVGIVPRWRYESGFGPAVSYIWNWNGISILILLKTSNTRPHWWAEFCFDTWTCVWTRPHFLVWWDRSPGVSRSTWEFVCDHSFCYLVDNVWDPRILMVDPHQHPQGLPHHVGREGPRQAGNDVCADISST